MRTGAPRGKAGVVALALAVASSFAFSFSVLERTAFAGEPAVPRTLDYSAPSGCPSRAEFDADVRKRTAPEGGSDSLGGFEVSIERVSSGRYRGRLVVRREGAPVSVREVRGKTCAAVAQALVVFVAIALQAEPPPEPDTGKVLAEAREAPNVPAPKGGSVMKESGTKRPELPPPSPPRPGPRWRWTSGAQATYGRAGVDILAARVFAELLHLPQHSPIAPAVRASWGFGDFSIFPPGGGEARFRLKTLRLEGCASIEIGFGRAALCSMAEAGSLTATTTDLPVTGRAERTWASLGLLVRPSVGIGPWISIELELGAAALLTRPAYGLEDPFRLVYRAPGFFLTSSGGVGLSARFQ